ncbi:MAG: transglycosylase SLT domain-containing protein [Burkholderiales bacterium]|nr:transglycosylase SLT domain-containing protein [Burkholderiales bacterium]MDE2564984.1 transglycosylase SLT domain-containing protein [Burkholderiales bacterium]
MRAIAMLRRAQRETAGSLRVFVRDVVSGVFEVSHNALALVGLMAVGLIVFALGRADLRHQAEVVALEWLQSRQEARDLATGNVLATVADPSAVTRATATSLADLPRQQATLASWIARRYRVAPEPIAALVHEAWSVGQRAHLDPTLILAIMAVESSFNPFAQSTVGAQGLMQVLTRVHDDKYEAFGGARAAFDPISNLRVGVQVLHDCIVQAGSVQEGLRYYVGAALLGNDGGYVSRVLAEQSHMRAVADGQRVPVNVPLVAPGATAPATAQASLDGGLQPTSGAAAGATTPPPAVETSQAGPRTERVALAR